jgi:hypothetical protein
VEWAGNCRLIFFYKSIVFSGLGGTWEVFRT